MASKKQVAANRRNAAKSTGPKSVAGKKICRMNALKHGLQAEHVLLPGEDPEEFEVFFRNLKEAWQPVGAREDLLLEEIVDGRWQLRRARVIRTATMRKEHINLKEEEYSRRMDEEFQRELKELNPRELEEVNFKIGDGFRPTYVEPLSDEEVKRVESFIDKHAVAKETRHEVNLCEDETGDPLSTLAVVYGRSSKGLEKACRYENEIVGRLPSAERELERVQEKRKEHEAMSAEVIDLRDLNQDQC